MAMTIVANTPVLEAMWEHGKENVDSHQLAYFTRDRKFFTFSAKNMSMMIVNLPKAIESSIPSRDLRFTLDKVDGQKVFTLSGFADRHKLNLIIGKFLVCGEVIRAVGVDPSKLTRNQLYEGLNGAVKMRRLKPVLKTKDYHSLMRTNEYYWFHGIESDLLVLRLRG